MNVTKLLLETVKTQELKRFLEESEWFMSSPELKEKYKFTNISQLTIDRKLKDGTDFFIVERGKEPLFLDELYLLGCTSYISKKVALISPTGMAKIALYTFKEEFEDARLKAVKMLSEQIKIGILN